LCRWAELNYTWKVEPTAFQNSIFLNRKLLETEKKNEYDIYKNNPLLVKFWDIERMRGTDNCTVCTFNNINYTGSPTEDLKAYYCSSSYRTVSEELPNYGASDATANMTGNVLLMHLDETSGTVVEDHSGAGNNGTNQGATRGVTGKFDTAFSFDGSGNYVSTANAASLNMHNLGYTIEVWAKVDDSVSCPFSTERLLVEYGNRWHPGTYQLTSMNDGNFKTNFYGRWPPSQGAICTVDWTDGEWHHLVGLLNTTSGTMETYYDGEFCADQKATNTPGNHNKPLYLGSRGSTKMFFNCELDEVAIYNRSLSAAEIKANYKRGVLKASRDTDNCVLLTTFNTTDLDTIYYT